MDKEECKIPCCFSIHNRPNCACAAKYSTLCIIKGDTTELCKRSRQIGTATFYEILFEIVLEFGLTELKAHIRWYEKVSVIPIR